MRDFEYLEPKTLDEASRLIKENRGAKILAGGASLMVLIKNRLITPSFLVNLKTISGLGEIHFDEKEGLRIGTLTRHRDIQRSKMIERYAPILIEAASKIATPAIRNMGTIGGNICHAEPSADFPPSLIAMEARLRIVSSEGERTIPIEGFFLDFYESVLSEDEILIEIQIPPLPKRSGATYIKLDKVTNSMAIVGVASVISLDEQGKCIFAGLGLGGVGPTPIKVIKAKEILLGEKIGPSHIDKLAKEAQKASDPVTDIYASAEYRREMVYVLTQRALWEALKRVPSI